MTVKRHKPRFTVTVDQDLYDTLEEYTQATNSTFSGAVNTFLREAKPAIERITEAMKLAKSNDPRAMEVMRALLEEANQGAQKVALEIETEAKRPRSTQKKKSKP